MLEGFENTWRNTGTDKSAYYFNVPAGHYTFKLKATSSYGVWAEKSFLVVVLPPWWQTWWAYTLYALLLALAIWIFIKWRTKSLQHE